MLDRVKIFLRDGVGIDVIAKLKIYHSIVQ